MKRLRWWKRLGFRSGVYTSLALSSCEDLWKYLVLPRSRVHCPWMMIEDFNEVIWRSEVRGGQKVNGVTKLSKRLDMAMADIAWHHEFPETQWKFLSRSDHFSILLRCDAFVCKKENRPFCFQAA
ncbi:hypothetical protein RJT34_23079 [Clitoria ternatea]|uniref:Uncharacterized protein n=1 Tax=Clitoria ternatea TaxID=43366 RepID=A0AAN9FKB0_CLITE